MKKNYKIIISFLISMVLIIFQCTPIFAFNLNLIQIYDSDYGYCVSNGDVEITLIENSEILKYKTDENGYIQLNNDDLKKVSNSCIYVKANNNKGYQGEISTILNNNIIKIQSSNLSSDHDISFYGATDWNTTSSKSLGFIWVPFYKIPTYGGLTSSLTFNSSYTGTWTVSGGGLVSASFSKTDLDFDDISLSLSNSTGKKWMLIYAKVKKYQINQSTTTGQKRTIYTISNNIYELKRTYISASFGNPSTVKKTISKGNTSYVAGFGTSSSVGFTASGTYATDYGKITGKLSTSGSKALLRKYKSTGKYYYELGIDGIKRS